jgi:hypothetical protein
MSALRIGLAVILGAVAVPAAAEEVFLGIYAHGVDTPFTFETGEGGGDVVAGYRFERIEGLRIIGRPAPYVVASVNTAGDTSFAGGGLSWTIGEGPIYLRPAIGLVIHDGPDHRFDGGDRTDLGSRVLFEPEVALGYRIDQRIAIEASWMHVSHARLFNREQNPGLDLFGARVNIRL